MNKSEREKRAAQGTRVEVARLSNCGRAQSVELPEGCHFDGPEVYVKKSESIVILFPKNDPWAPLLDSLDKFSDDFMSDRNQPAQQHREGF